MKKLRIVFMGTPDFAVGILDTIIKSKFEVVAVITTVDKPAGRGQKIKYSAIKEYALDNNLPILQPSNLKDPIFIEQLVSYQANLQVVVAFRMLPQIVWSLPEYGTFNLHASILPHYRGAAPINWALINGETRTGVTTFFIDDKIDTGAIILSNHIDIDPTENAGSLHDKLMILGSATVVQTLNLIRNGAVKTMLQNNNTDLKLAHKLTKDNCKINWSKPGIDVFNHIRGLSPYPLAWTTIIDNHQEWIVKIDEASFEKEEHSMQFGQVLCTKKEIKVAVFDGFIVLKSLQFPGKKKLKASDLLNGMTFSSNTSVV